ncbi:hypothetical protein PG994_006651 [Apiospora phragmitis]|uniref:Uncharacterized protein n=1 Tax=Apiospora phragmitis TaxID=2905665 RepID=A0ABR1VFP7_9PEZI
MPGFDSWMPTASFSGSLSWKRSGDDDDKDDKKCKKSKKDKRNSDDKDDKDDEECEEVEGPEYVTVPATSGGHPYDVSQWGSMKAHCGVSVADPKAPKAEEPKKADPPVLAYPEDPKTTVVEAKPTPTPGYATKPTTY